MEPSLPDVVNRVVAFVDILGFRSLIDQAFEKDQELLVRLNQTLENIVKLTAVTRAGALGMCELSPCLQATAFSDCVVISDCFDGFGFQRVVATAALLAADLLSSGILSRGAFAMGRTIHNDRLLFGKGVIAAYQLEQEVAVFPRLIFADDLVPAAQNLTFSRARQDFDGVWYLDVFSQFNDLHQPAADVLPARPVTRVPQVEALRSVRRVIVEGLKKYTRPSIVAKYRWLAIRFNETVKEGTPSEIELVNIEPRTV